jgi:hypothetical protein
MPGLVESRPLAGVDYPRTLVEFDAFFRDEAACRQTRPPRSTRGDHNQ